MLSNKRLLLVVLVLLAEAAVSGLLLFDHRGAPAATTAVETVCGAGPTSGCETVSRSPYSEIAGIPIAAFGLTFCVGLVLLLALSVLTDSAVRAAVPFVAFLALALALIGDLVLFALQAFVIRAFCRLCLTTYALNLAAFVLLIPARKCAGHLRSAATSHDGRLLAAGWLAGLLGTAATVWAVDAALVQKAARGWASILGPAPTIALAASAPPGEAPREAAPAPPAATAPANTPSATDGAMTTTTSCDGQLRQAQEQARRLQGILDDSNKLQQYLGDKAVREFDASPVRTFNLSTAPPLGSSQAPIRVVAFSDFECPWCRNFAGALSDFVPESAGRVAVHFKHYPLENACNPNVKGAGHVGACLLALGGICTAEQGRFWPYHDRVFQSPPPRVSREAVIKIAGDAGADPRLFETCLGSAKAWEILAADIAEAKKANVNGTPTAFINGRRLPGINSFLLAIERESKRLGLPPLQPQRSQ